MYCTLVLQAEMLMLADELARNTILVVDGIKPQLKRGKKAKQQTLLLKRREGQGDCPGFQRKPGMAKSDIRACE